MLRRLPAHLVAAAVGFVVALPVSADPVDDRPAQDVFSKPLPASELENRRAGDSTLVLNHIDLTGTTEHINVQNSASGNNSIAGGAFTGAAGFPIVIQNSGNGVLIQNATIINMTLKP